MAGGAANSQSCNLQDWEFVSTQFSPEHSPIMKPLDSSAQRHQVPRMQPKKVVNILVLNGFESKTINLYCRVKCYHQLTDESFPFISRLDRVLLHAC